MTENVFSPADILLPAGVDMTKWSVIACDQFSSEGAYWGRVDRAVGAAPSTLRLIVPEAHLDRIDTAESARDIARVMEAYIKDGVFRTLEGAYVYLERTLSDGGVRRGLVGKLDLEAYDYAPGTQAPVRASEGTIVERLPARIDVRRRAPLELSHVMALIDDRDCRVIEPLADKTGQLEPVYDFELIEGGGSARGWRVGGDAARQVDAALLSLCTPGMPQLIIGDGNHSLAAAKGYWDEIKTGLSAARRESHPARYALVELNNVYDPAIRFEAIHRIVEGAEPDALIAALEAGLGGGDGDIFEMDWAAGSRRGVIRARAAGIGAFIGAVQAVLDRFAGQTGCALDYIHDRDSLLALAEGPGRVGLLLPAMDKADFFKTVIADGLFPRKSFSIGHARDKRYYLECRRIAP